jgi:hypothetical protein
MKALVSCNVSGVDGATLNGSVQKGSSQCWVTASS